jgi:acetylornithine deacetylase
MHLDPADHRAYLIRTLQDLVQIDSTNPALVDGGAGEEEIATYVADAMRDLGLSVDVWEPAPGRPNVVGRRPGTDGGPSLLLNAHLDTVGVDGMEAPFSGRVQDGRMYGRGTQDMKGSLAAQLTAVRMLDAAGVDVGGDLLVAAVADEEHASVGTEAVVERYAPDAAIVTEPTDLDLALAHKGFAWIDITTRGRAAHGSRPAEGVDANMHMGRVLHRLDALSRDLQGRDGHPLVGVPSLHAAQIEGGSAPSVYAAECFLRVERRTVPGETKADVRADIESILDACAAADPAFEASAEIAFWRDPLETPATAAIANASREAAAEVLGHTPDDVGASFWTDAALHAAAGTETVVLGPVGEGLHTDEEWVDLESVLHLAEILARTAERYGRRAP